MAQPVWVLSVDLQTKTATFQSGMADAAKSARGAFTDIKTGSADMGRGVSTNMFEARHGVMLLGEEFGIKLPRALTAFITSIGPIGAAMEAAFPFLAIAVGATLLIEHLASLRAAGIKLTEDQIRFGTAVQNAFNQLDQRLLQAEIKSDELRNDHLGALRLQLELIDKQSMAELVKSFEEVAKGADVVFADLKTSWYQFGIGSAGAKHALDDFQAKYDALLAKGKDKEASDLLRGTKESAERILQLQQAASATTKPSAEKGGDGFEQMAAKERALADLRKMGLGYTDKEVQAQQTLVDALNAQVTLEGKVAALKNIDKGNATAQTGKDLAALQAEGARAAAEHAQKMGQLSIEIERETASAQLATREASVAERLALDIHLADEELAVQMAGNAALVAALDKGGKDYNNQLKGLQEKAEELTRQHAVTVAGLQAKATEQQYREDIQALEAAEREKIEATLQGSAARIAAIDSAIKDEAAKNLQETAGYRDLLKQRVEAQRQYDEEAGKLAEQAGKEQADNTLKMGELALAAERSKQALADSARRVTIQQRIAEETKAANDEYELKLKAMQQEAAALDKGAKDYQNKLKAINDKELELTKEHENQVTQIRVQAEMERNQRILSAEQHFNDTIAAGLTQVLMGHKSFAAMMDSIGNQIVSGMMENAIKSILTNDATKESDAAKAARDAYKIGVSIGGPAGIVLGPIFGAAAFAKMMAFEQGGIVPGIGTGDTVPAMLTPGEGVVPRGVMDQLSVMARSGQMGNGGNHYHAHVSPTYNLQALDATGMDKVLDNHGDTLVKHVEKTLRRMNK